MPKWKMAQIRHSPTRCRGGGESRGQSLPGRAAAMRRGAAPVGGTGKIFPTFNQLLTILVYFLEPERWGRAVSASFRTGLPAREKWQGMSEDFGDLGGDLDEPDLAAGLKKKKFSGKQLVLFVILPLVLLLGGGLALWTMTGDGGDGESGKQTAADEPKQTLFYDVPEMLVNLNSGGVKPSYLKIKIALEVDRQSAIAELDAKLPRVIDNFQVYLRELRLEDLNGSAGMFRLKEELLSRVNTALYPTRVKDVLFKEMLVQ